MLTYRLPLARASQVVVRTEARPPLFREGAQLDCLVLYDDGTHGDVRPGDSLFTIDSLVLPVGEVGIGVWPLVPYRVDEPGVFTLPGVRARSVFRSIDTTRLAIPHIDERAPDARESEYVVSLTTLHAQADGLPDLIAFAERYYEYQADDRDFLAIVAVGTQFFSVVGFAYLVRTVATGLGDLIPARVNFGSPGRLKLLAHLGFMLGADPGGRPSYCHMVHEFNHRWAAHLGALATDVHWNERLERETTAFGIPDGTCRFNDVELYLAGMLPPDSVDFRINGSYTMDDLRSEFGERLPAWPDAQRDFAGGLLLLHDRPLTDLEIAYFHHVARLFGDSGPSFAPNWWSATGGRSSVDFRR